jgi:hypothetical protein
VVLDDRQRVVAQEDLLVLQLVAQRVAQVATPQLRTITTDDSQALAMLELKDLRATERRAAAHHTTDKSQQ